MPTRTRPLSPFMQLVQDVFIQHDLWPDHVRFEYLYSDECLVITWKVGNEWHVQRVRNNQHEQSMVDLISVRVKLSL